LGCRHEVRVTQLATDGRHVSDAARPARDKYKVTSDLLEIFNRRFERAPSKER
jgi:hypothetical protein